MWLTILLLVARATGALFIFSGVSKLLVRYTFLASLRALPFLPAWSAALAVFVLPWLEVVIGSALAVGFLTPYAAAMSLALLLSFSVIAVLAIVRDLDVPCSCFGEASQMPLSRRTVARNAVLVLLLLPLIITTGPSPISMDALLHNSAHTSLADIVLLPLFPLCMASIAALIIMAQRTLRRLSPR